MLYVNYKRKTLYHTVNSIFLTAYITNEAIYTFYEKAITIKVFYTVKTSTSVIRWRHRKFFHGCETQECLKYRCESLDVEVHKTQVGQKLILAIYSPKIQLM